MPQKSSSSHLAPRLVIAAVLLAAAALTGCTAASSASAAATAPTFFNAAHVSSEPVSTLRENYALPPDPRHHYRLHDTPDVTPRHHAL
jgi:uncharacterized lipoprotein YbaY